MVRPDPNPGSLLAVAEALGELRERFVFVTTARGYNRSASFAWSPRMKFTRITVDPHQMDGVPCIRGLRIPVASVVGMVADGMTQEEILKAYPDLTVADIQEALQYAAEAVRERELPLASR